LAQRECDETYTLFSDSENGSETVHGVHAHSTWSILETKLTEKNRYETLMYLQALALCLIQIYAFTPQKESIIAEFAILK